MDENGTTRRTILGGAAMAAGMAVGGASATAQAAPAPASAGPVRLNDPRSK